MIETTIDQDLEMESNRRILIVDDNESIHGDFRKVLGGTPVDDSLADDESVIFGGSAPSPQSSLEPVYQLDSAFQGQEALAKVRAAVEHKQPYALAFVDVRMPPGWDGVETIPHLWSADPALHIVICSAYSDHSWDELITKLGLSDRLLILKKPFDATEVRQVAVSLTEKWNLARRATLKMHEVQRLVEVRTRDLEVARAGLASARDAAEAANRAKSAFLANMSHELRTPLTAILGYAENLLDWELPEDDRKSAARTILRNGEHLLTLLNDILDVSKIEAGKFVIETIRYEPAALMHEALGLMRARAESQGLTLEFELEGGVPRTVESDPTRLRQILANLIGNSIKFTPTGGIRVIVKFDTQGADSGMLNFDIVDTGIGMTEEAAATLFQPFQQADVSTTREFGGTGLGLYISRRLAHMLGGDVSIVETAPGRGSRFRASVKVRVPAASPDSGSPPSTQSLTPSRTTSGRAAPSSLNGRILLVEDGVDNQKLIEAILVRAGAEVEVVGNGLLGVERAMEAWTRGRSFDVILMDMQMPVMDGYEAVRRLRGNSYPGQIIALTAHTMAGDSQKCLDAGCNGYAAKPISRMLLLQTIEDCLQQNGTSPSRPAEPPVMREKNLQAGVHG